MTRSRRTRTAAFLSTATLLTGAAFSLVLAPSASAASLTLLLDPPQPAIGDVVHVSSGGCVGVPIEISGTGATGATGAAEGAAPAATPAATPPATATPADDSTSSVTVTVTRDGEFYGSDTATPSLDGSWQGDRGIAVNDPGDFTVTATCDLGLGLPGPTYDPVSFTVDDPTPAADPSVTCAGCDHATPGDTITVGGANFPSGVPATVTLTGYGDKPATVNGDGAFEGVTFVIAATQATGTIDGQVAAAGVDAVPFTVSVTAAQQPGGGDVDGTVPGNDDTTGTGTTSGTDDGTTSGTDDGTGSSVVSSAPTLPATGTDSVWPGVIGGLLVLSGAGLLWASRRRDEVDAPAA